MAKGLGSCKLRLYFFIIEEQVTAIVVFVELPSHYSRTTGGKVIGEERTSTLEGSRGGLGPFGDAKSMLNFSWRTQYGCAAGDER